MPQASREHAETGRSPDAKGLERASGDRAQPGGSMRGLGGSARSLGLKPGTCRQVPGAVDIQYGLSARV